MKPDNWTNADLFDFAFFLHRETERINDGEEEQVRDQDREIFVRCSAPRDRGQEPLPTRLLLKQWLHAKREGCSNTLDDVLPGKIAADFTRVCGWILLLSGFFLGCGAVIPFLAYTGIAPVNVTVYFSVFVAAQFLLFLVQLGLVAVRSIRGRVLPDSLLVRLLVRAMEHFGHRFLRKVRFGDSATNLFSAVAKGGNSSATPLFLWTGFIGLQLFAISFNAGVISATLGKVLVSDIAFGWQSTLQLPDETLAEIVRWIALPWSWCVSQEVAYPGLNAIAGSRMLLKDGIYQLSTVDLVSWWPFLLFSVGVYGLVPRCLLLLWGLVQQGGVRKKLPALDSMPVTMLLRRMTTPLVSSAGVPQSKRKQHGALQNLQQRSAKAARQTISIAPVKDDDCTLFIPDELYSGPFVQELVARIAPGVTADELTLIRFGSPDEPEKEPFRRLSRQDASLEQVILIQEGWMPPIEETAELLRLLKESVDSKPATLLLLGKPRGGEAIRPATESELALWKSKLRNALWPLCTVTTVEP